ncbi:uncharacterized protein BP5553_04371 [Venustampulla echinocandica]|uniref:C2H2-type domain-containing protein n=1 Tax=Venustampulla echinocandica TaxID=2656787 RepID=A0A370TN55_9HELO|nr:uncharacterized protein BP5553_04371 [Venustampulla echinocandica]RDL36938.1 hypothetical protein BP5553_04371 [Venustampulla echinocandica]
MPASTRSLEGVEQSLAMLSAFRSPLLNTRGGGGMQVDSESAIVKYLVEHFRNNKELYLHADADVASQLLGSHVGSDPSELNLEFSLTPVTIARSLVPHVKAKIRLLFVERSNGTFNDDALSSVWIKEWLRAILCRQIRSLQYGYVSELDWPLWDLARHYQDPDPAQILDLDEDVLTEVEAQDPLEAGNLDNLFITLAQLEEKVATVTVAATIIKRSKGLTAATTASEVERQLQEKFHMIIRYGDLITDEPLWRRSTGRRGQIVVTFDGPCSSTSKRGREGKDGQTEVVSAKEDSSRQPKKRKVHGAQNPFECGDCGRHFTSQRPLRLTQ